MNLLAIQRNGEVASRIPLPETPRSVIAQTVQTYARRGFTEPWIGYLAAEQEAWVGCCGFTAPPVGKTVEIAYFTFPGFEGRGVATEMARRLIAIAMECDPAVGIIANTLAEENASNHILRKIGFVFARALNHPEDGNIWEWRYETKHKGSRA